MWLTVCEGQGREREREERGREGERVVVGGERIDGGENGSVGEGEREKERERGREGCVCVSLGMCVSWY